MQTNANAAAHLATQKADEPAQVWILSFQVKVGRRWYDDVRPFLSIDAAWACCEKVKAAYGADLRKLSMKPGFLHD